MPKKTFLPIKTIIEQMPRTHQYRQSWMRHNLLTAWRQLFPHLPHEPQQLFVKGGLLYCKLSSLILSQRLRVQQDLFLTKLQLEMTKLGLPQADIKGVVFL